MGSEVDEWYPSPQWTLNFLHVHLDASFRRATSSRPDLANLTETNELWLRILQDIAVKVFDKGYQPWQFRSEDQSLMYLFPQKDGMWAQKGAKHVFMVKCDDKRGFTFNLVGGGDGTIVRVNAIYEGSTNQVLPSAKGAPGFEKIYFDHSCNHWANLETTIAFMRSIYRADIQLWMDKKGVDEATARREAKFIWLQDCWPVFTSRAYLTFMATECPCYELKKVPYGRTDQFQINDTHWQKPIKNEAASLAEQWYARKLRFLRTAFKVQKDAEGFQFNEAAALKVGLRSNPRLPPKHA